MQRRGSPRWRQFTLTTSRSCGNTGLLFLSRALTVEAGTVSLSGEAGLGPPRRVPKPAATRNRVLDQPHLLRERPRPPAQDRWAPGL
ncbi:hypothetical protein CapIbe_006474 [Capra ibex]